MFDFLQGMCSKTVAGGADAAMQAADLIAQQQMACWAGYAVGATLLSVALSAIALVGLFLSLRQTAKSISHTRDLGQAQARAYVHAVKAQHLWTNTGGPYTVLLHVENVGATPARVFEVGGEIKKVRVGQVSRNVATRPYRMKAWSALGSKQPATTVRLDVSEFSEVAREFANRVDDHVIVVLGTIRYQDVFDKWFQTDFAFFSETTTPRAPSAKLRRPTARIKAYATASQTSAPFQEAVDEVETLEVDVEG